MKTVKKQLEKEIEKLHKEHDKLMSKYYASFVYKDENDNRGIGDSSFVIKADKVLNKKTLLDKALKLIIEYEKMNNY